MNYPNLFDENESAKMIVRVQCLTPNTQAKWGTMDVAQMLAHCVVPYAYEFEIRKIWSTIHWTQASNDAYVFKRDNRRPQTLQEK